MLHPVFIVTVWVVLTGVRTTRLLTSVGSSDSLDCTLQEVTKLKSLNEIPIFPRKSGPASDKVWSSRVPYHATVLDTNLVEVLVNLGYLLHALGKRLLGPKISSATRTERGW